MGKEHWHLPRLSHGAYRGLACVHWIHTIRNRQTGWLGDSFHARFCEILFHTLVRFRLCCPVYCLMPDHMHLIWMGWDASSDQRRATEFFRRHVNVILRRFRPGASFQRQPYDHVIREDERRPGVFDVIAQYIAANPARAGIVTADRLNEYPYAGCLVPGYPDLSIWRETYWATFWRAFSVLEAAGRKSDA